MPERVGQEENWSKGMTTDPLTGIPVATAQFDSLDGREMFLMALAARDLVVTQMTDLPGHPYQGYAVSYLTEPLPAVPDTDRMADDSDLVNDPENWAWQ